MVNFIIFFNMLLINYLLSIIVCFLLVSIIKPLRLFIINFILIVFVFLLFKATSSLFALLMLLLLPILFYFFYSKIGRIFFAFYFQIFVYSLIVLAYLLFSKFIYSQYVITLIVSLIASVVILSFLFTKKVFSSKIYTDYYFNSVFRIEGASFKLRLYLDTGNFLFDKKTKLPIVLVSLNILRLKYLKVEEKLRSLKIFDIDFINDKESVYLYRDVNIFIKVNGVWRQVNAVMGIIDKDFFIADGLMGLEVIK